MKNIINQQDRADIIARIQKLTPDSKAQWGKMNAGEALCHLNDQLRLALGQKSVTGTGNFFTKKILKNLILWGMPAPKGKAKTHPDLAQEFGGTKPTTFEADRKSLIDNIEGLAAKPEDSEWKPNPIFGKLSKKEWGRMAYTHIDHHLKQFNA
ncbi:MAG TPA: DUF1569 domain-containing protein [Patescibacteria group bacterium]|nr:DUF1569 domain-containing protein [Patescibacteria group bacterium]